MARILAKALNCEKGRGASPCLECSACTEIAAGTALDVVEIDAASNRRIDDIRELRESVRYRPARDAHKVFIIDEAHQITTDAFNALLKTLEEPPEWVVFVLCTTEPQSIPITIQSRCQSFQFRTVEIEDVIGLTQRICEKEGVEADIDALTAIALAGDGSIRDSLSTLDQAIASCGKKLEAGAVRDLLGAIPAELMNQIVAALAACSPQGMLDVVEQLFSEGRNAQHFIGELTRYFRNVLVLKVAGAETRLVTVGPEERSRSSVAAEQFSAEDLTRYLKVLLELYDELQSASQERFRLEMGLMRMAYAGRLRPIEEAIAALGSATPASGGPPPAPVAQTLPRATPSSSAQPRTAPQASARSTPAPGARPAAKPAQPAPPAAEPPRNSAPKTEGDLRSKLTAALRDAGELFVADALQHSLVVESAEGVEIRPSAEDRTSLEFGMGALDAALPKTLGRPARAKLGADLSDAEASTSAPPAPAEEAAAPDQSEAAQRALADADVQAFQQRFTGRVREVRNLKEHSQ